MRKTKAIITMALTMVLMCLFAVNTNAASVTLSADEQWIEGVSTSYEYITSDTYNKQGGAAANNAYWTSIAGGARPDGTKYAPVKLIEGNKLGVLSAWYGKTIYLRAKGSSGTGAAIPIPSYSDGKALYKSNIKMFNAFVADTGGSFYDKYIANITDNNGYLIGAPQRINITVDRSIINNFNKAPLNYLTDAEGNYIYDLVAIGVCTDAEPDISGAAAWVLKDYIGEGYGFLIGHDTMYGYGGVNPNPNYTPNANDTTTPIYENNTKNNGHWNLNWLVGINKPYTDASPYDAASMILNSGDYTDKSTLYGDYGGKSTLRIKSVTEGNPTTDIAARCPTNYPYAAHADGVPFKVGEFFDGGACHTNQQIAYGKVWIDYATNTMPSIGGGVLVTDTNSGLNGTNNFYLTTNGNFGMIQIGHEKSNLQASNIDEYRILANTIMYLSQRAPCEVCQSKQGGSDKVHTVKRISSAAELAQIADAGKWFTYPSDGCYILINDIELPSTWEPIEGFTGHFNADSHVITVPNGKAVFAQKGILGEYTDISPRKWNLGEDATKGYVRINNGAKKLTGVARVSGFLNGLFRTDNEIDYANYKVVIKDAQGQEYSCITNREGKYILSNLPCIGKEDASGNRSNLLFAKIYDANGNEIVKYGKIAAFIPENFWNTNETVPLYLNSTAALPIKDITVYDEQEATFIGKMKFLGITNDIKWEYKMPSSILWRNIGLSDIDYIIDAPKYNNGEIISCLKIKSAKENITEYHFRAVFTVLGAEYNTFEYRTGKQDSGMLTVLPRPIYITQAKNTEVWEKEVIQLTVNADYYKSFDELFAARWQFRSSSSLEWEDVLASPLYANASCTNSSSANTSSTSLLAPYRNTSVLTIPSANMAWNNYEFRVLYNYGNRKWGSSDYNKNDNAGILKVKSPKISCTVHPQNIKKKLAVNSNVVTETATYTATFKYFAKSDAAPSLTWEYKDAPDGRFNIWTSASAAGRYKGIVVSTNTSAVTSTGTKDEYLITTTMQMKNMPIGMDKDKIHNFFRAKGDLDGVISYSDSADISIEYTVDIKPGKPTVFRKDNGSNTYIYPKLKISAPNGLRNVRIRFDKGGNDARNKITYIALPHASIIAKAEGTGFLFSAPNLLPTSMWEEFLRKLEISVFSTNDKLIWNIDELNDEGAFDPTTGNFYEYVPAQGIMWTDAYNAARARYNSKLQVYGQLMTIGSAKEQEIAQKTAGATSAWLGGTRSPSYIGGYWGWMENNGARPGMSYVNWAYGQPLSTPENAFLAKLPNGQWEASKNNLTTTIGGVVQDKVRWETMNNTVTGAVGTGRGWEAYVFGNWGESVPVINYAGLNLVAPYYSWTRQGIEFIAGHKYYYGAACGEFGGMGGQMHVTAPWFDFYNWGGNAPSEATGIWTAPYTGTAYISASVSPAWGGDQRAQLFYSDFIDLTAAFGAGNEPSPEFCFTNMRAMSGNRSLSVTTTANYSDKNGYLVEYASGTGGFIRNTHAAEATDIVNNENSVNITGREGIRITLVKDKTNMPVGDSFDYSNTSTTDIQNHFGASNKIDYRNGKLLEYGEKAYSTQCTNPKIVLPSIIKSGTTNNLKEVENYFRQKVVLEEIASKLNMRYDDIISGIYKIMLEPIIYLEYNKEMYAMTATEVAIFNATNANVLRVAAKDTTHHDLPFSMYLSTSDLGFDAWTERIDLPVSDSRIISNLGLFILRFGSAIPDADIPMEYRTDTDVILSCEVQTDENTQTSPDNPAWVKFTVNGDTLMHENIYLPKGGGQRAYAKWHTPTLPGNVTIMVTSSSNVHVDTNSIMAEIVELKDKIPPDAQATDRNVGFIAKKLPPIQNSKGAMWIEWTCEKQGTLWAYNALQKNARVSADMRIQPDERVPTAQGKTMKSGYGFNSLIETQKNTKAPINSITDIQNVITYFPEFDYKNFCRLSKDQGTGKYTFEPNIYSHFNRPVHFTPLWYPDGEYKIYTEIRDMWTPMGELKLSLTDSINIEHSVFDDWYVKKGY